MHPVTFRNLTFSSLRTSPCIHYYVVSVSWDHCYSTYLKSQFCFTFDLPLFSHAVIRFPPTYNFGFILVFIIFYEISWKSLFCADYYPMIISSYFSEISRNWVAYTTLNCYLRQFSNYGSCISETLLNIVHLRNYAKTLFTLCSLLRQLIPPYPTDLCKLYDLHK